MSISLGNLAAITSQAALLAQIEAGIRAAMGNSSSITVTVVIHYISVQATYAGLPSPLNVCDTIDAYVAMASVSTSTVTVNGQVCAGGRRLSEEARQLTTVDAPITNKVLNDDGVDVVQEAQRVVQANNATNYASQLENVNSTAYANLSITLPNPPSSTVSSTVSVTGTNTPPSEADVENYVANNIAGGGTVSANVSSTGLVATTASPTPATTAPTPSPTPAPSSPTPAPASDDDSLAPITPMMTIWAVLYSFAMS
jgi:hypothetical protein